MDLAQIELDSDKRNETRLNKVREVESSNFNAQTHKSIEIMPYMDDKMIFRQQGRRLSWGKKNARYVSARHYPNADCAKEIIDELVRCGAKNVIKEDGKQIELF